MKFLLTLAAVAIGVSAQSTSAVSSGSDSGCLADYIVTRCLETEEAKVDISHVPRTTTEADSDFQQVDNCKSTDYKCLCAAYEAVST